MPVPKKRTSHSKRNMRRSHHSIRPQHAVLCSKCGEAKLRHRICPSCGEYRGHEMIAQKPEKSAEASA